MPGAGDNPNINASENVSQSQKLVNDLKTESQLFANLALNLKNTTLAVVGGAEAISKAFIGARSRMSEFVNQIIDANPKMKALGASSEDVYDTIVGIAAGSRRQFVAATEDMQSVFSAAEVTGVKVGELVEKFAQVGYNYRDIGENVLDSVNLVNSLGLNARLVMGDVLKNTDQLSRYNFQNGVQGLTRMAAQASMLRFDMNQTFQLAEKVLDPDQAVSVASAFQRLGVSAGNLVDPLSLLNQSLTDPSGLQDSLINVAKQFTYFDEATNSFKINPQGILTLKEIEAQTGVSAKSMRDAALAAADLDKRLAEINKTGIAKQFNEEDKMVLANISRMKDGVLEVKVKDSETGRETFQKLTAVTEQQLKATIDAQKNGPATIEELQKAQLNTGELALAQLRSINATLAGGIIGIPGYGDQLLTSTNQLRDTFKTLGPQTLDQFDAVLKEGYERIEAAPPEERDAEIEKFQNQLEDLVPKFLSNVGTSLGSAVSGNFGKKFFEEYLSGLNYFNVLGKTQETTGKSLVEGLDVNPQQKRAPKSRAIYGTGAVPPLSNAIDIRELLGRVTASRGPQEVKVNFGPWNPTIQVKGIPEGYDQTAFNRVIDEMTRQTAEKLKSKIEGVQQTLV